MLFIKNSLSPSMLSLLKNSFILLRIPMLIILPQVLIITYSHNGLLYFRWRQLTIIYKTLNNNGIGK